MPKEYLVEKHHHEREARAKYWGGRDFARQCALQVVHLWTPPPVVLDYLRTGDGREAAYAAIEWEILPGFTERCALEAARFAAGPNSEEWELAEATYLAAQRAAREARDGTVVAPPVAIIFARGKRPRRH